MHMTAEGRGANELPRAHALHYAPCVPSGVFRFPRVRFLRSLRLMYSVSSA
jgi:hypothetical protein